MNPAAVLLAACLSADTPAPPADMQHAHDLATLIAADALALDGRRELFRVRVDSSWGGLGGWTICDCASPDDVHRTLWLVGRPDTEEEMTVAATLRRLWWPEFTAPDGTRFPGFWEHRLAEAVRRRQSLPTGSAICSRASAGEETKGPR